MLHVKSCVLALTYLVLLSPALLATCGPAAASPVPKPLTDKLPGATIEAAWSPDGKTIVFQRELKEDVDLYVIPAEGGEPRPLVTGPDLAIHPAWSPDGKWIVYSSVLFDKTVAQGLENGYNLHLVRASGRSMPRRLTAGLHRDYTPCFSRDGAFIYFSSTRGAKQNSVGLYRISVEGGAPECILHRDATDVALVGPDVAPNGHVLACGFIAGFRGNWSLRLVKTSAPHDEYPLTETSYPMYGPRWSPDGRLIACTGYRPGDNSWGLYVVEARTGALARVDTGPGNSRSPAWSPDGKRLVFENNRTGEYKLYVMDLPRLRFTEEPKLVWAPPQPVVKFSFASDPGGDTLPDLSGRGNDGKIVGKLLWQDGGAVFGDGQYVQIPKPKGCDFGTGGFSVRTVLRVDRHTDQLRLVTVGDYPIHHLGWQIHLSTDNHLWFNSRTPTGEYTAARSDSPPPLGKKITVVGIRYPSGKVEMFVDGVRQSQSGAGATMSYPAATQIRIGTQYSGGSPFVGTLYEYEVYSGILSTAEARRTSLQDFLSEGDVGE